MIAKTTTPTRNSGNVYTAAKEIEEAGGKCLPNVLISVTKSKLKRFKKQSKPLVVDILINNVALFSSQEPLKQMKRYDLMHQITPEGHS